MSAPAPQAHSDMGPSSLERRMLCPGSYRMELGIASQDNVYSERGTFLHGITASVLSGAMTLAEGLDKAGDDSDSVMTCINYVEKLKDKMPHLKVLVETRLDLTSIHPAIGFGTADIILLEPFMMAHLIDLKFTYKDPPPARENPQTATYAVGVMDAYNVQSVQTHLVLAHFGRASDYIFASHELEDVRLRMRAVAECASMPWAPLRPSIKACTYCKAVMTCPEALLCGKDGIVNAEKAEALSSNEAGNLLRTLAPVDTLLKALRAKLYMALNNGQAVEGWQLELGKTTRGWSESVNVDQLVALAKELDKPAQVTRTEIISPAQLEKLWGKSKPVREKLESLIVEKLGEPKLAPKKEKEE